tara:strand:- start:179 stop:2704 length:2526 start_codon:yes stop_codon:yes gene_type:complete
MVKWYLATYQNGVFSNDLGIIESSGDYVYKLKNYIPIGKGPEEEDWLRITIANNNVEEWNGSNWNVHATLTGLEDDLVCWVYGYIVKYVIVAGDQKYTLEDLTRLNDIGKTNITSITITNSVTEIGENAFDGINVNVLFIIPEGVLTKLNEADPSPNLTYGIGKDFFGASSAILVKDYQYYTFITNDQIYYLPSFSNNYSNYTNINGTITGTDINNSDVTIDVTTITHVIIGDSVTSIGERAFQGCSSLASVMIGDSVMSIGDDVFYLCNSLALVNIPKSVETIGIGAFIIDFDYNTSIRSPTSITIETGTLLKNFPEINDFINNGKLTLNTDDFITTTDSLIINNNNNALVGITDKEKTEITIPNTVKSIGGYAFINSSLSSTVNKPLIIPNLVTEIGDGAFTGCSNLVSVNIPAYALTSIGPQAFFQCSSLASVTFGENSKLETIGDGAFHYCSSLASVTIPNSVTSIGDDAFSQCSSLASVTIPNSVTSIGEGAFYRCSSLASVTIPDSVTSIGYGAFEECSILASVTFGQDIQLTTINGSTFYKCESLGSVTIPDSVKTIGGSAFYDCSSLASVTFGENSTLETIGNSAFYYCSKLVSVTIPASVTEIGREAFSDISADATITLESGIELTSFSGISSVSSLNNNDFTAITNTTNGYIIIINKHTKALLGVTSSDTESITIPFNENLTSIGKYAFYNKNKLKSVTIGNSVTSIGESAFQRCINLASLKIGNSVTTIGRDAFATCSSLTSVTIPDSVTSIGVEAFDLCSSLASVTIGNSVTSIGNGAFSVINSNNRPTEATITIPQSVLTTVAPTLTYGTNKNFFSRDTKVTLINPDA